MVSKASDDFPLPLGPVMTVNSPSGKSRSIPLRLFCRAPRISTQPRSGGAETRFFSTIFEPTGDNPRCRTGSQIFARTRDGSPSRPKCLDRRRSGEFVGRFGETSLPEFFAQSFSLRDQFAWQILAERFEKFRLCFEFLFPFLGFDREKLAHRFA